MGCTESKVIDTTAGNTDSRKIQNNPKAQPKENGSLTVKEFFEATLELPKQDGQPYSQPELPDFYVEQALSFENENVDDSVWGMKIDTEKKNKTAQGKSDKKSYNNTDIAWLYRKPPNRKYHEPDDLLTVDLEFEQGTKKRHVVAVGGMYLSGKTATLTNALEKVDVESTHSLVLLGNLFDMLSVDPFHQKPTELTSIENLLAASEPILQCIKKLATEMKVYYMLGSHDADLTRVAIERLLGDNVIYVQQTNLVLSVKVGNDTYRARFTTGHQWDIFNDRKLNFDKLLAGKPIGYYLSRASANNPQFSSSTLLKPIASAIPSELDKGFWELVSKRPIQDKITEKLLLHAFQLSKPEELIPIKCVVDEGKYISIQPILEYPYIKHLVEQYGEKTLMSMVKALIGDYSGVAHEFDEDVMVTGLGDEATLSKVPTASGHEIICAGTGSCSNRSDNMTMLKILYPKQGSNGKIEILDIQPDTVPKSQVQKIEKHSDENADTLSVESL